MPDISDALKRLDAIAASAGIEQQQQPAISLADIDQELADLKALADERIAATLKLESNNLETEHVAPDLSALKQAMADAHPDRGGTNAAFIEARERYVEAKQTLPENT